MSLNSKQMLPERIRSMRQMEDLINAEDVVLVMLEEVIDQMYQRAAFLHEELVNEIWLEEKLGKLVNGSVHVKKETGRLHVEITFDTGGLICPDPAKVIGFIEQWLPAHLAYTPVCENTLTAEVTFACVWQHDEFMTVREVKV